MPILNVTTPPVSTDLTLLATIKTELGITVATDDGFIGTLISAASDAIRSYCNRQFAREVLSEGVASYARSTVLVSIRPLVAIAQITIDGAVVDPTQYYIENDKIGRIQNPSGWPNTMMYGFPAGFSPELSFLPTEPANPTIMYVNYTGGWLHPGDDMANVTASAAVGAFTLAAGVAVPNLVVGDVITTSGFTNAANNGKFTVASVAGQVINVSNGANLVAESNKAGVTIAVRNLPRDLERAALVCVRDWYYGRDRDSSVKMERIGGTRAGAWMAQYDAESAIPAVAKTLLSNYVDYV